MPPVYAKLKNHDEVLVAREGEDVFTYDLGEGVSISVTEHKAGGGAWITLDKERTNPKPIFIPAGREMTLKAGYTKEVQVSHKER